jgi:hypothetical protein
VGGLHPASYLRLERGAAHMALANLLVPRTTLIFCWKRLGPIAVYDFVLCFLVGIMARINRKRTYGNKSRACLRGEEGSDTFGSIHTERLRSYNPTFAHQLPEPKVSFFSTSSHADSGSQSHSRACDLCGRWAFNWMNRLASNKHSFLSNVHFQVAWGLQTQILKRWPGAVEWCAILTLVGKSSTP